jgi:vancomycin permeability regulator SanA
MSNPLFSMFGGMSQMPNNSMMQMVQQFMQFRQNFTGDPRQKIQELLNSGRVSQDQYNRAVQMAQLLQKAMGGK